MSINENFRDIAVSFESLINGLAYVDEDLANKLSVKFSKELEKEVRKVYALIASEIASGLSKPPKKTTKSRRPIDLVRKDSSRPIGDFLPPLPTGIYREDESVPMEELPENPNSFSYIPDDVPTMSGPLVGVQPEQALEEGDIINRQPYNPPPQRANTTVARRLTDEEVKVAQQNPKNV